jgi:hypothetical protein
VLPVNSWKTGNSWRALTAPSLATCTFSADEKQQQITRKIAELNTKFPGRYILMILPKKTLAMFSFQEKI